MGEKIEAKNHLESYCFNIKSTLEDNSLKDKISNEERNTALEMVNETISWLDENQMADKEEYKDKQIQLENSFKPVVQKLYAGSQSVQTLLIQGDAAQKVDKILVE